MRDMFGASTLSLPPPFTTEHHPLRVSSEAVRPQPSGGCNFLLVQPSAKSKICACQVYHHNRSAPGNVCDCGHSACFHVHTFGDKAIDGTNGLKIDITEKLKKLEDMIIAERQARESDRMEWQREIRTIREIINPFYRNEADMQRKLAQMELKLNTTVDEQHHLNEQITLNNHSTTSHKDTDSIKTMQMAPARLRTSTSHPSDDMPGLTSGDDRSSASSFSRHHTPSEVMPAVVEPESPRSSGILNLAGHPRPSITPTYTVSRPIPQIQDEPRSSGFLGVDMRKRLSGMTGQKRPRHSPTSSLPNESTENGLPRSRSLKSPRYEKSHSRPGFAGGSSTSTISPLRITPSGSLPGLSPFTHNSHYTRHSYQTSTQGLPQRRDYTTGSLAGSNVPFMALDVLANVSTASNGLH